MPVRLPIWLTDAALTTGNSTACIHVHAYIRTSTTICSTHPASLTTTITTTTTTTARLPVSLVWTQFLKICWNLKVMMTPLGPLSPVLEQNSTCGSALHSLQV